MWMRSQYRVQMNPRLTSDFPFRDVDLLKNKAGYTATPDAYGWAGAVFEVTSSFGQEQ